MKLVAQMIVAPVEVDRYLYPCVDHLLTFCDRVMICVDGTVPGIDIERWGADADRLAMWWLPEGSFYAHEGKARQRLLELTQQLDPTHVLAIDADEFVTDGAAVRAACESVCPVLTLGMAEVWAANDAVLRTREDGGWRHHQVPILWQAPDTLHEDWKMRDMALACGREPEAVRAFARRDCVEPTGVDILHFGWANKAARRQRYDRYVTHDNGRFHNRGHLDSIMWLDGRCDLQHYDWPTALEPYKSAILAVANRESAR